jgi:hypothetical protein
MVATGADSVEGGHGPIHVGFKPRHTTRTATALYVIVSV